MIEEAFKWLSETNIQAAVIGPVATGLLGIIPYALHKREKKKINIAELIQEIEELATEHWCSAGSDSDNHFRAIKIYSRLKKLGWKIDQNKEKNKSALIAYRQAVTSSPFDDPTRVLVLFEDPRIVLISDKAKELRKALGIKRGH